MTDLEFFLEPVPPFRLDLTAWALQRRADNPIDRWDGATYRRLLVLDDGPVAVAVSQRGTPDSPVLQVVARGERVGAETIPGVTTAIERLLGLDRDLTDFDRLAAGDDRLAPLAHRFRGLKPPRFPTPFEALVNAIACQQITLTLGIRILGRLADRYGHRLPGSNDGGELSVALPRPAEVVGLTAEQLRAISFSRQKTRALVEAGHAVVEGRLDFASLATLDDEAAVARLRELPGVGRWTAEYVLLRGLGRINVFPVDDVGGRNNLQRWLGIGSPLDAASARQIVAPWSPYAGLVYFHLLLDALSRAGHVAVDAENARERHLP